ncbi:MAG: hypothetical protein C5S48_09445 [Candidatus Methanogaster sp.]|nr:MAG: hypothetical protein C5S48_09445 [ANME-2 cluster archaeon]
MITLEEKEKICQDVVKEFPSDLMLREFHFIRELMNVIHEFRKFLFNRQVKL